jgi:hypothetical protein
MFLLVSSPGSSLVARLHSSPHAGVSICTQQQEIGSPERLAHWAFLPKSCWRRSPVSWARFPATPPCNACIAAPASCLPLCSAPKLPLRPMSKAASSHWPLDLRTPPATVDVHGFSRRAGEIICLTWEAPVSDARGLSAHRSGRVPLSCGLPRISLLPALQQRPSLYRRNAMAKKTARGRKQVSLR